MPAAPRLQLQADYDPRVCTLHVLVARGFALQGAGTGVGACWSVNMEWGFPQH